jgi:hypothetical protein
MTNPKTEGNDQQERVQRIEITRDGDWLVIGDEDGEFARVNSDTMGMLLPYLRDLLYGCGTLKPLGLLADDE